MDFKETAEALPNGFHDAELHRCEMNYVQRTLEFDLVLWIGDMGDTGARELYRPARVTMRQVAFLAIEPPDVRYPWLTPGPITIDAGEGRPPQSAMTVPEPPAGNSTVWVYLEELNSFLHCAVGDVTLEWIGPEENRT